MYETEDKEWPEPEKEERFDWSLSMTQIEKRYSPLVSNSIKPARPKNIFRWDRRNLDPAVKETVDMMTAAHKFSHFDTKFKKKYLYTHTIIHDFNPDLLRWIYDNILSKREWQV